jgi:hypothetical protein
MVLAVIPTKKLLTERASILDGPETLRKLGPVFEGLELTFRVRIVIRDMGPTVRLGDPQISQHEGHRLGGHRGAAIGVDVELTGNNELFITGAGN